MVDVTNEVLNYISIITSAILPVVLVWYFKTIERRRSEKELKVASELKTHNEKTASDLKLASMDIATELQKHLDEKINNTNKSIEDLGKRIEMINDNQSEISKRVDAISTKQLETHKDQLELISDLQHRADMTNGNIGNIRNDLMDVQEAIEDISDNMTEFPLIKTEKKFIDTRKKDRRVKRKQITDDSQYQAASKHNLGSKNH